MTAKIQAGNVENSVHCVTCSFKGETTFKSNGSVDKRVCFFCLDPNHLIADCRAWKQRCGVPKTKNVTLVESVHSNIDKEETYQAFSFSLVIT